MLTVYDGKEKEKWNAYVNSFSRWDVYYLYEYAYSLALHGDGEPLLICYEDERVRLCFVVMKQDIGAFPGFCGKLEANRFFDLETPYGYGGPLCDGSVPEDSQRQFLNELTEFCRDERIVAQFLRFHPLLGNQDLLPAAIETRYLRDTVFMDTASPDTIMKNMGSKNRNMVRKAFGNGVTVSREPIECWAEFLPIYWQTMHNNSADDYYLFSKDYFSALERLNGHACLFFAMLEGKRISGAVMLYNDRYLHYHLAGTYADCRRFSPGNLLLCEAACWASEMGIGKFHLGGGMAPDDSLFGFKKQFNKHGRLPFFVGRTIFRAEDYDYLRQLRKRLDPGFDPDNGFLIQYRR